MIIVLDTETCCGLTNPIVYDLGYIIIDNDNNEIIKKRNYIIKNSYDNLELFNTAYYKEKRPLYENLITEKEIKKVYSGFALYQLLKDIEKYNITNIFAYNCRFDFRSLNATFERFNNKSFNFVLTDIMDFIGIFTNTNDYKNFCFKNGYITKHKKPQPQKKAETLFRYLTNNIDFIESHTALSDSEIEWFILNECLKR